MRARVKIVFLTYFILFYHSKNRLSRENLKISTIFFINAATARFFVRFVTIVYGFF